MKYNYVGEIIPQNQRKDINTKIEYIVNHGLSEAETGISKEDIFNAYTGIGGLHGLNYVDYNSYYDFQKAKAEIEQGQFFTPYKLVQWIYDCLHVSDNDLIADLTSGHGSFASCAPVESNFYGCELEGNSYRVAKYLYPDAHFENTDIRFYNPNIKFDYVVGNPPYNLRWNKNDKTYLSEYYYCLKAAELLKPAGIMAIIVPKSFCSDSFSDGSMINGLNDWFNYICQIELNKNTFKHLGVESYKTKILFLQKKSEHLDNSPFCDIVLSVDSSDDVWLNYLKQPTEKRKEIRNKVFLEVMRGSKDEVAWNGKIQKILYDIKRHPKTTSRYAECCEYVRQYKTQKKPDHIKWDEWQEIQIKPHDVESYLKRVLRAQNGSECKDGRIIKHNYSYEFNGEIRPINSMILQEDLCFESKSAERLISKKRKEYNLQSMPFSEMKKDNKIAEWLNSFSLVDDERTIKLNDMQKSDLNLFIQKPYHFVQWEQGSGKTFAGIAIAKYRMQKQNCKNAFIVSTAIAIKNNWCDVLDQYGINYIIIDDFASIQKIKQGQFVLITLNMMCKYYKIIKKYCKIINQKAILVLDESDNVSNPHSKRTKAVLAAFRKLKFKTLMTGTCTRNNIAEIYPQLELLYNNSINMLSESKYVKVRNKEDELIEKENEFFLKPYPAYNTGLKLFTASHIPEKITVFGVSQFTQDVLNAEILKKIIDKTIITRTFEEITGKNLYEIKQIPCEMGDEEKKLYKIALEEFYKLEYLFNKTGNSRKDAMLKILNQLLALLNICAAPQTLKEYDKSVLPGKFDTVLSLLADFSDERVAIGVRHVSVVKAYEAEIRKKYPDRPVFVVTGNETTLNQRKAVIKILKATKNGILISTQQSLSASMNIDFVNKCIIPELHWNNSSMSQYYFRFIRYTSTKFKQVYFVTYKNSIESNLLKMVLVKDKLNLFMKDQDLSDEELYDRFGISSGLLENLLYKEKTEDGYVIRWGNQEIG